MTQQTDNNRYYIALKVNKEDSNFLDKWCKQNNFDIETSYNGEKISSKDFNFHTTLMYSQNTSRYPIEIGDRNINSISMTVKNISLYGPDKNIPVLEMEPSYEVLKTREYIEKHYGLKDSWDGYKPHITISYNYSGIISSDLIKSIIGKSITYDCIEVHYIKDK